MIKRAGRKHAGELRHQVTPLIKIAPCATFGQTPKMTKAEQNKHEQLGSARTDMAK